MTVENMTFTSRIQGISFLFTLIWAHVNVLLCVTFRGTLSAVSAQSSECDPATLCAWFEPCGCTLGFHCSGGSGQLAVRGLHHPTA